MSTGGFITEFIEIFFMSKLLPGRFVSGKGALKADGANIQWFTVCIKPFNLLLMITLGETGIRGREKGGWSW